MAEVLYVKALCNLLNNADRQRLVNFRCHLTRLSILIVLSPVAGGLRRIAVRIRDRPTSGDWCFCTSGAAGHSGVRFQRTIQRMTVSFNEAQLPEDCFDGLFGHHVKARYLFTGLRVLADDQHIAVILSQ